MIRLKKKKTKQSVRKYIILALLNNDTTGPCSPSGIRFTMKPLARGFEPPHLNKQLPRKIIIIIIIITTPTAKKLYFLPDWAPGVS